jgi:hypothetical protein
LVILRHFVVFSRFCPSSKDKRRRRETPRLAKSGERERAPPVRGLRARAPLARDASRARERVRVQALEHKAEDVARKVEEPSRFFAREPSRIALNEAPM